MSVIDEVLRPAGQVLNMCDMGIYSKMMIEGRDDLAEMDRSINGHPGDAVGSPNGLPHLHSPTGK